MACICRPDFSSVSFSCSALALEAGHLSCAVCATTHDKAEGCRHVQHDLSMTHGRLHTQGAKGLAKASRPSGRKAAGLCAADASAPKQVEGCCCASGCMHCAGRRSVGCGAAEVLRPKRLPTRPLHTLHPTRLAAMFKMPSPKPAEHMGTSSAACLCCTAWQCPPEAPRGTAEAPRPKWVAARPLPTALATRMAAMFTLPTCLSRSFPNSCRARQLACTGRQSTLTGSNLCCSGSAGHETRNGRQ